MLREITADLRTPQTDAEQRAKAREPVPPHPEGEDTAAEVHGAGRAESGFTVAEMTSEYRALRASVIRLWTEACGSLTGEDLTDLMRFNEAIDQSLAESLSRYTEDVDRSREMFIAILGHDLRTPIGAVMMASRFMLDTAELTEPHLTLTKRVLASATRMNRMVGDLLDFTRGRLGSGVPVTRGPMDLGTVVRKAVEEMTVAHPRSVLQFKASGDLRGKWDAERLGQVTTNLLGNAVQHGAPRTLISITAEGDDAAVVLRVHNFGPPIPKSELYGLFSPFKRFRVGGPPDQGSGNLGLGLYIAERIVTGHGGTMDVRSTAEAGTQFSVRLPR
jgi:signal transduction histidine kinase